MSLSTVGDTVGGTGIAARNVISGNLGAGVVVSGNMNVVEGNFIGTDAAGTRALGNATGVSVTGSGNIIGGTSGAAGNLISGNLGDGIALAGGTGNAVQGNLIGTDATGTLALGNNIGVSVGEPGDLIGGTSPGAGNVISGNTGDGIQIRFVNSNVSVQGNHIGTDATGTRALGNAVGVDIVDGLGNLIGGTSPAARNVIAGNRGAGILINSNANTVAGNFIGTDASGAAAVPNCSAGVYIRPGNTQNLIGGTGPGAGNVISGNAGDGVYLGGSFNTVQGNLIGCDASGTRALGNGGQGMCVFGGETVGGTVAGARNVISGNSGNGILLYDTGGLHAEGNYIGTDITGTRALGNALAGVALGLAFNLTGSNSTVGGTAAGAGNVIAGNGGDGVSIIGRNDAVQGNRIGIGVDGAPLGNGGDGVRIFYGPGADDLVGGTTSAAANTIAFNGGDGVRVTYGTGCAIRRNAIFGYDAGLGIELIDGGNNGQAYPELTSATSDATSTTVEGTLTSAPSTTFTVEFFADSVCNPSGYGKGERFLGSTTVTTDASGQAAFVFTVVVPLEPGQFVAATATDPAGDTSQFSACAQVSAAASPISLAAVPPALVSAGLVGPDASVSTFAADRVIAGNSEPARSPGEPGPAGAPSALSSALEPRSASAAPALADSAVAPADADLLFQSFSLDW